MTARRGRRRTEGTPKRTGTTLGRAACCSSYSTFGRPLARLGCLLTTPSAGSRPGTLIGTARSPTQRGPPPPPPRPARPVPRRPVAGPGPRSPPEPHAPRPRVGVFGAGAVRGRAGSGPPLLTPPSRLLPTPPTLLSAHHARPPHPLSPAPRGHTVLLRRGGALRAPQRPATRAAPGVRDWPPSARDGRAPAPRFRPGGAVPGGA